MRKKIIAKESLDSFEDEKSDIPKWILPGVVVLLICGAVYLASMQYETKLVLNATICEECPICMANFTTYDIPANLPDMSLVLKDPLCNDFCYVQSQRYGCDQWVNFGLKDGRCQCDLKGCITYVRDINGSIEG